MKPALFVALTLTLALPASAQQAVSPVDRLFHEQILTLDSHLDTPSSFERPGWRFGDWHNIAEDGSQIDLPRMAAGGLDGGFWVIYTPQGPLTPQGFAKARDDALMRAVAIQRVVAEHDDELALATTAADAERLHKAGKRSVYQSIENSYPLGQDLSLLTTFHRLGVRMAGPVHSKNNQFADSTTDTPRWNGLSPLGRQWVMEMNRLGMVIDGSHTSDAGIAQLIELSKTPIILSHHGPDAVFEHPRNIPDELMRKLARSGGVMQMNSIFLSPNVNAPERDEIEERQRNYWVLSPAERRRLVADRTASYTRQPFSNADFEMFMRSVLHAIRVMGVDHVGMGADWDGGGGVVGMEDITHLPKITARLRQAGLSDADIEKIWSGNVLRLMRRAEQHAAGRS